MAEMTEFFDAGMLTDKSAARRSSFDRPEDKLGSMPVSGLPGIGKCIALGKAVRRCSIESDGKLSLPMSELCGLNKSITLGKDESDGKLSLPMSEFGGFDKSITLNRAMRRLSFASTADGGSDGKLSFPMSDFSNSSVALSEFASTFADSASEGGMSLPMSDVLRLEIDKSVTATEFVGLEKAVLAEDVPTEETAADTQDTTVAQEKGPEEETSLGMSELLKLDMGIPLSELDNAEEAAVGTTQATTLMINEVPEMLQDWASWERRRQKVLQKRLERRSERYASKGGDHARGFCSSDCPCCR